MESSSARIRAAPLRFMVTPLTSGREPVYVGDRVTAPCKGYDGVYAGMVKAINVQHRTLYVMFDDGDEDEAVAIRSVRHVRGADACMPTLKRGARAAGLQMRPKPKKLRLPHTFSVLMTRMFNNKPINAAHTSVGTWAIQVHGGAVHRHSV